MRSRGVPRTRDDLTNTAICPACFSPLTSSVCTACELDLNHPAASELYQYSTDAAAALDQRLALIGRMRYETAQLLDQLATARNAENAVVIAGIAAAEHEASAAETQAFVPPTRAFTPPAQTGAKPPRRSSVQVVMLIVGVSLLSIAAIFFLVFAFVTYGLLARSLIIGGITIAAIATASWLQRKLLRSTAEGIAVFAALLIYLDAFAARANDLAGAGSVDGALYWGATLVASAIAFAAWHRASVLRAPNVIGFAVLTSGVALLVSGLTIELDAAERVFATAAAASLAALLHPLARPRTRISAQPANAGLEGALVLFSGMATLVLALVFAFLVRPQSTWGSAIGLLIVGIIGHAHVFAAGLSRSERTSLRAGVCVSAGVGAAAVALTGAAGALRVGSVEATLFWPAVVAVCVALLAELVSHRAKARIYVVAARSAAVSSGAVAALMLLVPAVTALATAGNALQGYRARGAFSRQKR